nr:RICIN domain-containing protein [Actinomadura sp. CNU-125]
MTDGANVIQWECNGGLWQDWKFTHQGNGYYTLTNSNTLSDPKNAMCLEVVGSATEAGANVQQGQCDPGAPRQAWKVANVSDNGAEGYRLIAQHSGLVLEVAGASLDDGANVIQNKPAEPLEAQQVWKLGCLPGQTWRCPQ